VRHTHIPFADAPSFWLNIMRIIYAAWKNVAAAFLKDVLQTCGTTADQDEPKIAVCVCLCVCDYAEMFVLLLILYIRPVLLEQCAQWTYTLCCWISWSVQKQIVTACVTYICITRTQCILWLAMWCIYILCKMFFEVMVDGSWRNPVLSLIVCWGTLLLAGCTEHRRLYRYLSYSGI